MSDTNDLYKTDQSGLAKDVNATCTVAAMMHHSCLRLWHRQVCTQTGGHAALPAAALLAGCGNALVIGNGIAGGSGAGLKTSVGAFRISAGILAAS